VEDVSFQEENFTFQSSDGTPIFVRKWYMEPLTNKIAAIQIAHGMMEHSDRYKQFAKKLATAGFVVYANDHRGHGYTAKGSEKIGCLCENGFNLMVEDLHQLNVMIKEQNPCLPVFLFGHSMGSFLAQKYIGLYGLGIRGAILSGTGGNAGPMLQLGIWLAQSEVKKKGMDWRSNRLHKLVFGGYNKPFTQDSSKPAWLARDEAEVDLYAADPLCGQVCSSQFYYEFFQFLKRLHDPENISNIPRELPILFLSGDKDPVSKNGKGIRRLVKLYQAAGLLQIDTRLYSNGRHEMLHEINREEVMRDVISWFQDRLLQNP
jgi:alpha-beta hydrolase superfamily lysophospholipase